MQKQVERIDAKAQEPDAFIKVKRGQMDAIVTNTKDLYKAQKYFKMRHS